MSSQPSPHDAVLRRVLGDPATAASQLRAVLPADLSGRIDLDRLAPVSGSFLTYIETVGEAPADELHNLFAQLGPEAEEAYVTTAEVLRAEGRTEVLIQQLTLKFGTLSQSVLDTAHTASSDQLHTWTPASSRPTHSIRSCTIDHGSEMSRAAAA